MPIGVPKVPFRFPGEESAQWVDIYHRLHRKRTLFLCQDLEDDVGNQLIASMLYINGEESLEEVSLYINSLGGSVITGLGVYDIMSSLNPEVITICLGIAASMASLILAGGQRGKRVAYPSCRIMMHQPEGGSEGTINEICTESQEILRIRQLILELYSERTGQFVDTISKEIDRDQFMSAKEGIKYGLVDVIGEQEQGLAL